MPADSPCCLLARGLAGAAQPREESAAVLVANGRIKALGRAALESGAERRDLGDLWLCPAPLDAHVHLTLGGDPNENLARTRQAGVAAVRDLGNSPKRQTPANESAQPPLVISSGPGLCAKGEGSSWLARPGNGPAQMAEMTRQAAGQGVKVIKVFATGLLDFNRPGQVEHAQAMSREEIAAICETARELDLPVAMHGSGPQAARLAAFCGISSLEHGFFLGDEEYSLLAGAGVRLLPTISPVMAYVRDPQGRLDHATRENLRQIAAMQLAGALRAHELGVELVLGTDAGSYDTPHGMALHQEIALWLEAGIDPETVFLACTSRAARLMGLEHELGVIAPGARDWLLGVRGDPRRDPRVLAEPVRNNDFIN